MLGTDADEAQNLVKPIFNLVFSNICRRFPQKKKALDIASAELEKKTEAMKGMGGTTPASELRTIFNSVMSLVKKVNTLTDEWGGVAEVRKKARWGTKISEVERFIKGDIKGEAHFIALFSQMN